MDDPTAAGDELARIEAKIKSLVDAYLVSGRPYLLSKLGKDLGDDLHSLKHLTEKPLAQFLIDRFSTDYSIVLTGTHNTVQALVRSSDGAASLVDSIVEQAQSHQSVPRYNYRFWAAFSVPLVGGRRFLNLRDFIFQDLDHEPPSGDFVEVESEFVVQENVVDRDARIRECIQRWLAQKGFSAEQFIAKPRQATERISHVAGGRSILEAVIEALDRRQLANTSLPLDVVADLLRRRV